MDEENESVKMESEVDSDSSSDDDSNEQILINKAEELERQIIDNKYLYDAHLELVDIYQKLADLNSMRAAYERFQEYFPLTPTIWLTWIREEIKLATNIEEQENVLKLFNTAVGDYLSVDLWMEYIKYSLLIHDVKVTQPIIDRAIIACGLHTKQGILIWDTLRELEMAPLIFAKEEFIGSDEWLVLVRKVADIYKRQLSIPLIGMESTYKEWCEWLNSLPEGTVDPKPIEWGYMKAIKILQEYNVFEEKLLIYGNDTEQLYTVYCDYLKILKDPSAIVCLYERAILDLCLNPSIWWDYCSFVFKLGEVALNVSSRSLRNCPWSEQLWIMKIRILENLQKDFNDILTTFEQGLSNIAPSRGLELWMCYLEYLCRKGEAKEKVDKVFNQAIQHVGSESDPVAILKRWHARILAKRGDIAASRKIWNSIINSSGNKGCASVWLEFLNLEKQFGDADHARTLFQKAIMSVTDWPQSISDDWMMFERENGTLQDVMNCLEKCKNFQPTSTNNVQVSQSRSKTNKRKSDDTSSISKKPKLDNSVKKSVKDVPTDNPTATIQKTFIKDPATTVFISNLSYNVSEENIKEMFPNAANIELVLDRKGKSRGYAYVNFTMEEEAMTALARDREPLDNRPVFISKCKPDKSERQPVFKYTATVEENKLFVRGLPVQKTQKDVEDIFKPYGAVAVRLVVHKSGQPKGLAYVDFDTAENAKKALESTDQLDVDGHIITVAVSAPPQKKGNPIFSSSASSSEPIRHARSRLQIPMLPRSVQVKSNGSKPDDVPKSNVDFRNLFFKK